MQCVILLACMSPGALAAVRARLAAPEEYEIAEGGAALGRPHPMPLCFNLFGDLAGDANAARHWIAT